MKPKEGCVCVCRDAWGCFQGNPRAFPSPPPRGLSGGEGRREGGWARLGPARPGPAAPAGFPRHTDASCRAAREREVFANPRPFSLPSAPSAVAAPRRLEVFVY